MGVDLLYFNLIVRTQKYISEAIQKDKILLYLICKKLNKNSIFILRNKLY